MADYGATEMAALRAEENFVADTQLLLHEMMLSKQITRAELAKRLGVSRARITQLFSSECKNFTVRLLARAMHALDEAPQLSCSWTQQRDQVSHAAKIAGLIADPSANVVPLWAEDGLVVPPQDCQGECRSDPRIRAVLRSHNARAGERHLRAAA